MFGAAFSPNLQLNQLNTNWVVQNQIRETVQAFNGGCFGEASIKKL